MKTSRVSQLVCSISSNTATVEAYLESQGLPSPSFNVDAPRDLGIPPDANDIEDARRAALEATIELQDLLQGPTALLRPVTVEAMHTFKGCEPNETGHALAQNTKDNMFDWLEKHPDKARRFNSAVSTLVPSGRAATLLKESFDWNSIGDGTVVDVGGASGAISIMLAKDFPALNFVVQDLPKALEGTAERLPRDLIHRIKFMNHDFFTDQTVVADAYLLRAIFHNWPDAYCVKILQRLIPALKPGARIIVNDSIVPPPGTLSLLAERNVR
ncbi:uncharacterized protein KY384_008547 [Bacidia gigantensis]|uniref:uncharacterized protein n=1 Tax=Bacidia gigantensis TaxID=2732470 RepID=UPI001D0421AE|nr:uncharacterized protein KY384_008547 [Bacidia gigantensis]KAG8527118.1 hypothetical protein KY384_008547 [Bacidia gigantensis]